jgi:hypothetical protein
MILLSEFSGRHTAVVEVSSGEEPPCQKGSFSEVPEDVDAPLRALITLRDPGATILEDPSASAVIPTASPSPQAPIATSSPAGPCLEGPSTASAIADSPAREVRPAKPTAISSDVPLVEPTVAPSAVASSSGGAVHTASATIVHPSERTHPREPIVPSLAIATSFSGQVWLFFSPSQLLWSFPAMPCLPSFPSEPGSFRTPCI